MIDSKPVLAIDIGSLFVKAAVRFNGKTHLIRSRALTQGLPAFLELREDGHFTYGQEAKRSLQTNPTQTIFDFKRLLSLSGQEPNFKKIQTTFAFPIQLNRGKSRIEMGQESLPLSKILSIFFGKLRDMAQDQIEEEINEVIFLVPIYYGDIEKQTLIKAAKDQELDVRAMYESPKAIARLVGSQSKIKEGDSILIVDWGGNSLDCTHLIYKKNAFHILDCQGDTFLGGQSIDKSLFEFACQRLKDDHGVDLDNALLAKGDPNNLGAVKGRLLDAMAWAKERLAERSTVEVQIPFLLNHPETGKPLDFSLHLSREDLALYAKAVVDGGIEICKNFYESLKPRPKALVLSGGLVTFPGLVDGLHRGLGTSFLQLEEPAFAAVMGACSEDSHGEWTPSQQLSHSIGLGDAKGRFRCLFKRFSAGSSRCQRRIYSAARSRRAKGPARVEIPVFMGEFRHVACNRFIGKFVFSAQAGKMDEHNANVLNFFLEEKDGAMTLRASCFNPVVGSEESQSLSLSL